jgi:outer membrane protein assembly factor BamB
MKFAGTIMVAAALAGVLALVGCRDGGKGRPTVASAQVEAPKDMQLESLWSLQITTGRVRRAWVSGDYALVVTEKPNLLHLIRLRDGYSHWSCEFERSIETAYPPAISPDGVMVVSDNRIMRIDRAFGTLVCILDPEMSISARPILDTWIDLRDSPGNYPVIYVPSYNGRIWAMQIRRTEREMTNPVPGAPPIKIERYAVNKGWSTGTPAAHGQITAPALMLDGFIYICTSDGYVLGLKDNDGLPVFRIQTQGQVQSGVSLSGDRAYFGSSDYKVYCINRRSGDRLWEFPSGGVVSERPLPDPGAKMVFTPSEEQGLFGLDDKNGRELWQNTEARQLLGTGKKAVYASDSRAGSWRSTRRPASPCGSAGPRGSPSSATTSSSTPPAGP